MNTHWKQVLAAVVFGLFLPGVMLNTGKAEQPAQQPQLSSAVATEPTKPQQTVYISVMLEDGTARVVELETYILCVLLAEMPASFEMDALKAQAVAARTYALRRMRLGDRHEAYDVCTQPDCCQAYISQRDYLHGMGIQQDIDKVTVAMQETAGQVLTYGGQLAETTYFSCSGGRTENAAAVWGEDIAYLQAVDSPGEEEAEHFADSLHFTAAAFCAALGRELEGSPGSWLGEASYTEGGGVDMMFIGGVGYSGMYLRQALGLNSTAFSMAAENGGITITTRGKGHRVGMSQYGANAMALAGNAYDGILSHYYPGAVIDKWWDIE